MHKVEEEIEEKSTEEDFPLVTETGEILPDDPDADQPVQGVLELNIFKFEVLKTCLERTLNEYEDVDEKLGVFAESSTSPSFKIAFNTLLKYEILKEDDNG